MTKLFKGLCFLAGDLGKLIERLTDKETGKQLSTEFNNLRLKIGEVAGKSFDERNKLYQELIADLSETREVVRLFSKKKTKPEDLKTRLKRILENIDKVLPLTVPCSDTGIKETGGKEIHV